MRGLRWSPLPFVLNLAVVALVPNVIVADDELNAKVRTAWVKLSELEETKLNYGERAEVALRMLELDRNRIELDTTIRNLRIEIDTYPARRNNLQQEVVDRWNACRLELTELDRNLAFLKSRLQELNEIAIRKAEATGKRVRPLDRLGLLSELQKQNEECRSAFSELKSTLAELASAQSRPPAQAFNDAVNELKESGDRDTTHLVSAKQFHDTFRQFYGSQFSQRARRSGRMRGKR